jgi:histidyl-tRNA synthetase
MAEKEQKQKLSTEPYKGVRDFYPEDQFIQNYIFNIWKKTVESFGYIEYNASILEPTELYKAKSGEEIVNDQTYSFIDRGEREVTLRPEMTPTVARMVAGKKRELAFPLRWYSIPNLFRYERPQRGRMREHWQLNADIFGIKGIEAETEMVAMAYAIMKNFGISDDAFEIKINSRLVLKESLEPLLRNKEDYTKALKIIDKKHKITKEEFDAEWSKLSDEPLAMDYALPEKIADILGALTAQGITNATYGPLLVRGFDYYTDIVFEIFDKHPKNNRSLFGGGRYDELLSIFGEEPVPTVGFGMGDVTIRDVLETYDLLPKYKPTINLAICPMNEACFREASVLATKLRQQDLNIVVDYSGKKIGDQIKKAVKDSIPFVLVLGEDEIASKQYKIKTLATEEETPATEEEIATFITYKKTHN